MNEIISKINMELQERQWHPAIDVVQNDRFMRLLELTLTSGGAVWNIPEGASVIIRYLRSDGIGGEYDTLSDGTSAWSAQGNKLTVVLTPEMMTVSGLVQIWVTIIRMEQQISSFALALNVAALAQADQAGTSVFANTTGFLPAPASGEVGQYFRVRAVNDRKQVTEVEAVDFDIGSASDSALLWEPLTLTENEKQQARKNIGAAGSPVTAVAGQVMAVKSVDESGFPVEWEAVSVQSGTVTDAVLYTGQKLTKEQKTQARANIGAAAEEIIENISGEVFLNYPNNCRMQLASCYRYGKICIFILQIFVDTIISDNYSFTLATLPVGPVNRVWINNGTQFFMDQQSAGNIRVNGDKLSAGGYTLSGFFLIDG